MARWFLVRFPSRPLVLLSGALALSAGCSLALSGPSAGVRHRYTPPKCDTSKGLVFADGIIATTFAIIGLSVASGSHSSDAVLPVLATGVFIASAIHGNNEVNACNREMANYNAELASAAPGDVPSMTPSSMPPSMAPRDMPSTPPSETTVAQSAPAAYPMQPSVTLPSVTSPVPAAPVQPVPAPPVQQPPQPSPSPSQQQPSQRAGDDRWTEFWKEMP